MAEYQTAEAPVPENLHDHMFAAKQTNNDVMTELVKQLQQMNNKFDAMTANQNILHQTGKDRSDIITCIGHK